MKGRWPKFLLLLTAIAVAASLAVPGLVSAAENKAGVFDNPLASFGSMTGTAGSFTIYKEAITDNARNEGRRNTQAVSLGGADAIINSGYDCLVTNADACTKTTFAKDVGANLAIRVPVVYGLSTIRSRGAGVWPPLVGLVVDVIDEIGINPLVYGK